MVFPFGDRTLVATSAKEGKIYLLDRDSLGQFNATNDLIVETVPLSEVYNNLGATYTELREWTARGWLCKPQPLFLVLFWLLFLQCGIGDWTQAAHMDAIKPQVTRKVRFYSLK